MNSWLLLTRKTGQVWCPVVALFVGGLVVAGPADQPYTHAHIHVDHLLYAARRTDDTTRTQRACDMISRLSVTLVYPDHSFEFVRKLLYEN